MSNTDEVALLEYRIRAYIARTSMLQSRLLSTLDTLDVQQRTHQDDLLSITAERDRMKMALQRNVDSAKSAESEKDDMRDAVMKLIERLEILNDYSEWPHSQIYLSSLADTFTLPKHSVEPESEEIFLSYAASLIEILRKQRDSERLAHARTRDLADTQHVSLKAMLSRRVAELESYVAPEEGAAANSRRERERNPVDCEPMSRDEIVSVLELTAARNKILETEVKFLAKRLEEARSSRRRTLAYAGASTNAISHPLYPEDSIRPVDSKLLSKERPINSDQLNGLENQINELGLKIDAFAAERKAIVESVGLAPLEVEPNLENPLHHPSDELHLRLQHVELECDRLRRRETKLRDQLNDSRMDAQEREAELLAEISVLRQKSQQRTSSNYAEVAVETEPPGSSSALWHANPENLLEPNEDEQSMELATPLMPTSILTTHLTEPGDVQHVAHSVPPSPSLRNEAHLGNSTSVGQIRQEDFPVDPAPEIESPYVDPPTIPLPHSPDSEPEGLSAWEENSPSDFTISALDFPIPPGFRSPMPSSMPGHSDDVLRTMGFNNGTRR